MVDDDRGRRLLGIELVRGRQAHSDRLRRAEQVAHQRVVVEVRVPRVQTDDGRKAVEKLAENLDERSYREDEGFFDRLKSAFR